MQLVMQIDSNLLQYVLAPALLGVGGFVGWIIKTKTEELRAAQTALRDNRLAAYEEILDPFIALLQTNDAHAEARAFKKVASVEYRRSTLRITLFGSDSAVKAWNNMMQHFYLTANGDDPNSGYRGIGLYADFLLEVRKDLRNKTDLDRFDMLAGFVKDMARTREKIQS
jgi:hypothetical protein